MTPLLDLRQVRKSFAGRLVLDGIDLRVDAGERVAVIGPSGSGKSTLLRIALALEPPDAGSVHLGGLAVWPDGPRLDRRQRAEQQRTRLQAGLVFQQFNLFPHLTALANVALAPRQVLGQSRLAAEQAAKAMLARVGLGDRGGAYPRELSGGQRQRCAIARALALRPRLMLFDEPTSALDPELVGEVTALIADLATDAAMTVVVVTHQLAFARQVARRIVLMDGGKVVEDGSIEQVLDAPRTPRARAFVGALAEVG